jgi:hypothetical protein
VDILDEIHIKGKGHYAFPHSGASYAKGDVCKRFQCPPVSKTILIRMLGIIDNETQSGLSISYCVDANPTVRNKLIVLIYIAKNFKTGLRIQREDSFRYLLGFYERIVAYSHGRRQRGAVFT